MYLLIVMHNLNFMVKHFSSKEVFKILIRSPVHHSVIPSKYGIDAP